MSADRVTVGELIGWLKKLPKDLPVVVDRGPASDAHGTLDGPKMPWVGRFREGGDGWHTREGDRLKRGLAPPQDGEGEEVVVLSPWPEDGEPWLGAPCWYQGRSPGFPQG